jgi:hypothetical protein
MPPVLAPMVLGLPSTRQGPDSSIDDMLCAKATGTAREADGPDHKLGFCHIDRPINYRVNVLILIEVAGSPFKCQQEAWFMPCYEGRRPGTPGPPLPANDPRSHEIWNGSADQWLCLLGTVMKREAKKPITSRPFLSTCSVQWRKP